MAKRELYFVSCTEPSGKSRFHPAWVDKLSGAEIQQHLDVQQAIESAEAAGLEPDGSVFTSQAILAAFHEAQHQADDPYGEIKRLFTVYESREDVDNHIKREGDAEARALESHYERICDAIDAYLNQVMPVNTKSYFCDVAGITRPPLDRVLTSVEINSTARGVSWPIVAKVLHAMGMLDDIADLIESRVSTLRKAREEYVAREGIVEPASKRRHTKAG